MSSAAENRRGLYAHDECSRQDEVVLIVATQTVQRITNRMRETDEKLDSLLESFDVTELSMEELETIVGPPLRCIHGICTFIDAARKIVTIFHPISNSSSVLPFDNVCICTGSSPISSEISSSVGGHSRIVSIRDSDSVDKLASRLVSARRAVLVGNGGIALGLAHEAPKAAPMCQLVWAIRGNSLGTNFFDSSASLFLLESRIEAPSAPRIIYANDKMECSDSKGLLAASLASAEESLHRISSAPQIDDSRTLTSIFRHESDRRKRSQETLISSLGSSSPLPPRHSTSKRSRREPGSEAQDRPLISEEKEMESTGSSLHQHTEDTNNKQETLIKTFGSSMGPAWVQSLRSHAALENPGASSYGLGGPILLETGVEVEALKGSGSDGRVGGLADGKWHSIRAGSGLPSSEAFTDSEPKEEDQWPIFVKLTNGRVYGCDLVISATGAVPVTSMLPLHSSTLPSDVKAADGIFHRNVDGGLIVNDLMQTTGSPHVFAAGDAASVVWPRASALFSNLNKGFQNVLDPGAKVPLWFQMRLWSQARTQGEYAARCMLQRRDSLESDDELGDDCAGGLAFDLFAHSTHFLGFKVILLGLYNGQGLGSAYENALRSQLVVTSSGLERIDQTLKEKAAKLIAESSSVQVQLRVTPGKEYIKIIILHGRVVGALLVGDTDLEETLEHLIMNRLDLRSEDGSILDLLNPDIDIEDFFD